jgi:hypothetical protein
MKRTIISFGIIFILLSLLMGCGLTTSSKIVFHSARDGNRGIYVMNADGTGQTRLTDNKAMDYLPMWSPDRKKVVFVYRYLPGMVICVILVMVISVW